MPKKSTKSKSKRMTLRQKHKVIKKVREHHRKKRKEERKAGGKKKEPKDPGIPSQWPFKEELIKEMAWKQQQVLMQEKEKRETRKRTREEAKAMELDGGEEVRRLAALQGNAAAKQADFEARKKAKLTADTTQSDPDKSRRAFYKEFRKVVEGSDVVIQVLDARDPAGCRCPDVERYVRSLDSSKRIILLLNKMDLVPREVGERWLKHLRLELPTVAFKCSTQQQGAALSTSHMPGASGRGKRSAAKPAAAAANAGDALWGSGCLGADTLLQLLKNYTRNAGIKTAITVGVVGLPNVGKSSLINSLKRARVAQVGNAPGVTRAAQVVQLDKHIKLIDSPGIVFSAAESEAAGALRNAVRVERLPDPIMPVSEILLRIPAKQLMALYKVPAFEGAEDFLRHIAEARGKLKRGGVPDAAAAARIVLQDWNDGRIPYYTLPPERNVDAAHEGAEIVAAWAAEFDADKVFADERSAVIAQLPSMEEGQQQQQRFIEAQSAGEVRMDIEEAGVDSGDEEGGLPQEREGAAAAAAGDAMEEGDEYGAAAAPSASGRKPAAGQRQTLYSEAGQYDPHAARADRKRQKKQQKGGAQQQLDDSGGDSDFDFNDADEAPAAAAGSGDEAACEEEYGADADVRDADKEYLDAMEGSDVPDDA